jgi:hypothetical protein
MRPSPFAPAANLTEAKKNINNGPGITTWRSRPFQPQLPMSWW